MCARACVHARVCVYRAGVRMLLASLCCNWQELCVTQIRWIGITGEKARLEIAEDVCESAGTFPELQADRAPESQTEDRPADEATEQVECENIHSLQQITQVPYIAGRILSVWEQ